MEKDLSKIDLVFILDTTSSMYSYIDNAKKNINRIYDEIIKAERCHLRLGLINYRDHPPQDHTYITELHQLTDDVNIAKQFINKTIASGGGDLPEAICCGLADCLNKIDWLESSVKIAILIADAPPHGLCIPGDGFPNGCPLNNDPIEIAHRLAQNGITLYCVGCEPALAPYRDFFMVLSSVTGGRYLLLDNADNLSNIIIHGTNEEVRMEKLMIQIQNRLLKEAAEKGTRVNEEELTKRVHELLNETGKNNELLNLSDSIKMNESIKEMSKQKSLKDLVDYAKTNELSFINYNHPTKPISWFGRMTTCSLGKIRTISKKRVTLGTCTKRRIRKSELDKKNPYLIRKSVRILNRTKQNLNVKTVFGSIFASKNRRSERLMIKQFKFEFESKTENESYRKNIKIRKINDELNESKLYDMDCSRRLAKKVIARNKL